MARLKPCPGYKAASDRVFPQHLKPCPFKTSTLAETLQSSPRRECLRCARSPIRHRCAPAEIRAHPARLRPPCRPAGHAPRPADPAPKSKPLPHGAEPPSPPPDRAGRAPHAPAILTVRRVSSGGEYAGRLPTPATKTCRRGPGEEKATQRRWFPSIAPGEPLHRGTSLDVTRKQPAPTEKPCIRRAFSFFAGSKPRCPVTATRPSGHREPIGAAGSAIPAAWPAAHRPYSTDR